MRTDIVLESNDLKIIVDCKFYRELFQNNQGSVKFHSPHLYQLFAYLKNQEIESGWENANGMLLYPTSGARVDETVSIHGHQIRIVSINLDQNWEDIAASLLRIFECDTLQIS